LNNKEKIKGIQKEYRLNNKDKIKESGKEYRLNNKDKIKDRKKEYEKQRMKEDKDFRIKCLLRGRIRQAINKYTKTGKIQSAKEYGINCESIIKHLKPLPENMFEFEIDHIRPLCTFEFVNPNGSTNEEEIIKAFSPENHQLLTIPEHRNKSNNENSRGFYKR